MPDLILDAARDRFATLRAAASPPRAAPPAPARWDFEHLALVARDGRLRAEAADPWRASNAHGTACARCVAMHGEVLDADRIRPCPDCAPLRALIRRLNLANLPAAALAVRPWPPSRALAPLGEAADALTPWFEAACDLARDAPSLAFAGPTGRGKTCLALWLAGRALEAGAAVRWVSWPALLHALRQRIDDSDAPDPWRAAQAGHGLVVLDDFGRDGRSEWSRAQACRVFEMLGPAARVVVTTNAPPADWPDALGDAAASRLVGRCARGRMVLALTGLDLRREIP